ncbi:MAG TPA: SOS response-associated peptidase [Casimicrobiaceae bacterium]|nr:SOS response-associated peptidase [Casimicrobiaceae bacterium]
MCGRYELNETPARLGSRYRVEPGNLDFVPNADVRPTDVNPVVLLRDQARRIELRRWGFVPYWVEDPKAVSNPSNAVSETAADKPFFRTAFRKRRCIVPATAFFEWQVVPGEKRKAKVRIASAEGELLSLGGLYEYWQRGDEAIASYTILTTEPNTLMATVHTRMPVIIGDAELDEWLAPDTGIDRVKAMCMPCPSEWLAIGT